MSKEITAKATVGIYAEVINQIYDSLDKRFREAVSNAYDAHAKNVKISIFFNHQNKIIIHDNGYGMNENDLSDKYIIMGGGDNYSNHDTIGRIGIGALSVFALGDTIIINTRKKGSDKILTAKLDLSIIKRSDKHSVPLEEITIGEIIGTKTALEDDMDHFTEIVITDLSRTALDTFSDSNKTKELLEKIEKILPVKYRPDDPFYDKLMNEVKVKINNEKYIINVIFHAPHLDYENYPIYRKSIYKVDQVKVQENHPIFPYIIDDGYKSNLSVHGYLYISSGKQCQKNGKA